MNTKQVSKLQALRASCVLTLLAVGWAVVLLAPSAFAQVMGPDANGNITATDAMGDRFTINANNFTVGANGTPITETLPNGMTVTVNSAPTTIPISTTLANGTSRTDPLLIQFQPGNLLSVNGNLLTGPVSCTISTVTGQSVAGNCGAAGPLLTGALGVGGTSVTGLTPAQAAAMAAAPSAKSAAAATVHSQALAATTMISDRVRSVSRDLASGLGQPSGGPGASTYRGMSAGSADTRWGVWGDASGSFIGNNSSVGYDGTSVVALSGFDYIVDPNWLVGFNAGYTNGQLGLKSFTGTRTSNGALVGPYASYIISPNFSVDGLFNYTRLSNNIATVAPGPTGGFSSNRYTGAANLNAYTESDGIKLTLFTGYAYTYEGSQIFGAEQRSPIHEQHPVRCLQARRRGRLSDRRLRALFAAHFRISDDKAARSDHSRRAEGRCRGALPVDRSTEGRASLHRNGIRGKLARPQDRRESALDLLMGPVVVMFGCVR